MKVHDPAKRAQRCRLAASCAAALLTLAPIGAVELTLDQRTINDAVLFGQSRIDTERRRFHETYRITVRSGDIDFIEVVTPYRRVVLAAEDAVAAADRSFGFKQAIALLDAAPQQIDLHVELTFNPLNVYVGVPAHTVALTAAGKPIAPRTFATYARYTPRISERPSVSAVQGGFLKPGTSQPLIGGTMIAGFDGRLLNAKGTYSVVISRDGKDVARAGLDLGKLR